jgi:glycosyltransferase involved in cell wall biosynthesis
MISYPDVSENSSMYTDLAQEFALNGHKVFVSVANGNIKTRIKDEGGITVLRVMTMELFNTTLLKKGLGNILLPFQVNAAINKFWKGMTFDCIIVSTPPITYLNTIIKLRKKFSSKIYLILRDIFPQNAIDLKILKNPVLIKFFRNKEKKLYRACDSIGCMSQGNIEYIINHNPDIDKKKLHLLFNWKKINKYTQPDLSLEKKFGLEDKFIALYGGNFGKPQKAEFILDLAMAMSIHTDVIFLFIGEGADKKKINDLAEKKRLNNVIFLNSLPRHQYSEVVKLCDIGLVNLSDKFTIPNIPSRTLSYWEAKIPVLAAIDANTDFGEILSSTESGLYSITGNLDSYIANFERLYADKELRTKMGANGYRFLMENCSASKSYSVINEKLLKLRSFNV